MDYKERILMLVSECDKLSKEIEEINTSFHSLSKEKDNLKAKEKALVMKKSTLARELLQNVRLCIDGIEKQLEGYTTSIQELQKELDEKRKKFNDMCNDPTEYIKEQVPKMVARLMSYIEENLRDIGMDIFTSFEVRIKKTTKRIRGECVEVPTGEIVLCHSKNNNIVAESDEYPLYNSLYAITYDSYGPSCIYTEKCMRYVAEFGCHLCSEIENKFESDTFSVSIENSKIILELK